MSTIASRSFLNCHLCRREDWAIEIENIHAESSAVFSAHRSFPRKSSCDGHHHRGRRYFDCSVEAAWDEVNLVQGLETTGLKGGRTFHHESSPTKPR